MSHRLGTPTVRDPPAKGLFVLLILPNTAALTQELSSPTHSNPFFPASVFAQRKVNRTVVPACRIAGAVIAPQRPGTASGFIFISGEDETGISNAIIHPKVYERNQMAVTGGKFLMIEGLLQNQDSVVSVKASAVRVLDFGPIDMRSHDFH
jgi:DNA polymerase III alpha subunit